MPRKLSLTHLATSLDTFGVWDVCVLINDKEYTYSLSSEYGYKVFLRYYKMNRPGRALHTLKLFSIKGE